MIKGLPEKLRELREKYGYSQKQAAERLNVSPSVVSGYETGERTPSTEVLLAISYLYQCSTDHLLGKQTAPPENVIDASGLTDRQIQAIRELVEAFRKDDGGK